MDDNFTNRPELVSPLPPGERKANDGDADYGTAGGKSKIKGAGPKTRDGKLYN